MPIASLVLALATTRAETLRLKPVLDRRLEFRMELAMRFAGIATDGKETDQGDFNAAFLIGERVLAVEGETITLRRFQKTIRTDGHGEMGGQMVGMFRLIGGGTYTLTTDHRANVLEVKPGPSGFSAHDIDVVLPEAPFAPGATWEGVTGGTPEMRLRCTLRGIASVAGRRVALIDLANLDESTPAFRVDPESVVALDLADGRWLRTRVIFSGVENGVRTTMNYGIARAGAPEWTTILAAFPKRP